MEQSCTQCYESRLSMTGVILAGGKSSRLNGKSFLELSGTTVIEHIIRSLDPFFNELIIITGAVEEYLDFRISLVSDIIPGKGPLGGIYTGLSVSSNSTVFIVACDMPFVNMQLIKYMSTFTKEFDIVVPCNDKGYETLHAFYSKNCLAKIEEQISANKLKIANLYLYCKVREITLEEIKRYDPGQLSYFNMNTPQQYEEAKKIAASQGQYLKFSNISGGTEAPGKKEEDCDERCEQ